MHYKTTVINNLLAVATTPTPRRHGRVGREREGEVAAWRRLFENMEET